MLLLAAVVAATAALPPGEAVPRRQATATVRIVRALPLHFADIERANPKALRTSQARSRDGRREPVRLYEYQ